MSEALFEFEQSESMNTIVLSTMGPAYLDGVPFHGNDSARTTESGVVLTNNDDVTDRWEVFEIGMRDTFQRLTSTPAKNVIFVLDVPELSADIRFCDPDGKSLNVFGSKAFLRKPSIQNCYVSRQEFNDRVERYHALVKRLVSEFPSVILFDPTNLFCDDQKCAAILGRHKLYNDTDHLSDFGSLHVADALAPIVLDTLDQNLSQNGS